MATLTVVIPTLNEAAHIQALLADLQSQRGVALSIVVSDGGSSDNTVALARAQGALVLEGEKGRGGQFNRAMSYLMNHHQNNCDFLFLHADTRLPTPDLLAQALVAWRRPRLGHFPLRFIHSRPGEEKFMAFYEAKSTLNRPYTINGDQGLFLTREHWAQLGPMIEEWGFLEDQRLVEKARNSGLQTQTLPGHLATSARRFEEEGHGRRMVLSALIMAMYVCGYHEFFARARDVYRTQTQGGQLLLAPYFALVWKLLWSDWHKTFKAGAAVRSQLWQCFFWMDFRCGLLRPDSAGELSGPALRFYDRWVAPWYLRNWSSFLAVPVNFLYIGLSYLYFRRVDQCPK